ncbi:MAG: hypothetical protein EZS28_036205 [Streblomastix strix]|uniref:Uncharacterized protein n=1 Tax=Streblomastix strix TaxID=222440 RepID=A0A5J4UBR8_9EUKA|nr:MAG: hypothetical protein EZS28_036205 [Streblomastix strix]
MPDQKVGWPAELGAGGVNKLDYQVCYTPNVSQLYMNYGKPSVILGYLYNYMLWPEERWACQKRSGYGKLQNCCIPGYMPNPGKIIVSMVLVLVVLNRIIVQSVLVQTSPSVESIALVPSQLRSIGLLAGQQGPDFPVLISVLTHAMVELRVT